MKFASPSEIYTSVIQISWEQAWIQDTLRALFTLWSMERLARAEEVGSVEGRVSEYLNQEKY